MTGGTQTLCYLYCATGSTEAIVDQHLRAVVFVLARHLFVFDVLCNLGTVGNLVLVLTIGKCQKHLIHTFASPG